MTKKLTYFIAIAAYVTLAFPLAASAHATPVASVPETSSTVDQTPKEVSITFSEHIDPSVSSLTVTAPSGKVASVGAAHVSVNAKDLSVPLEGAEQGTYLVAWSVVSADDGHFTKGAYSFAVGKGQSVSSSASSDVEIVEIATTPEAVSMTVELLGNGILWAALLLFLFCIRPLLNSGKYKNEQPHIYKIYARYIYSAIALALAGGAMQLIIKAGDLANLKAVSFNAALPLYAGTAAGSATAGRMLAIAIFAIIFIVGKKTILAAKKVTWYELGLIACMCVFAYLRAKISHATANPFHPGFSILVNFFHLIEKDIWAGIVLILASFALSARLRPFLLDLVPSAFTMLAVDFGAVGVTACYIVWLHLKSFSNLFTTQWGEAFLMLLSAAVLLVGMRIYHVAARLYWKEKFARYIHLSLAAEFAFALLVVYFSSVVIITSPPLGATNTKTFFASDQGISVTLERSPYEDGMLLLTALPGAGVLTPTVTVSNEANTVGPVGIDLSKRFDGGYVFPDGLLNGAGPFDVSVTVPRSNGYDAHASFVVPKGSFAPLPADTGSRPLDFFTAIMMCIGCAAFLFALTLWYFSKKETAPTFVHIRNGIPGSVIIFVLAFSLGMGIAEGGALAGIWNPFKAECESDGGMWHLMLPTKGGTPVSQTPQEGCMAGMGVYQFPDKREYDYYRAPALAQATLTTLPVTLVAGTPTVLTATLTNADGTPADLFVDMEKLLHVVIISKDETVFAHIHADDIHPLTPDEIKNSTFTLNYTFPKAGEYLVSFDYSHGLQLESKQFKVEVEGAPKQNNAIAKYDNSGVFGGYNVSVKYPLPIAGEVETLQYTITKDGKPVTNIVPYLTAAMHISVVKNDFSSFLHIHGEVHPPGVPLPPIIVKNGQVMHTMAMMMNVPQTFGPNIEAHLIFPTTGEYTVWGEFKVGDTVIPTSFTVRVEN